MPFKNELLNLCHPWHHFDFFELTEVMRQQGDNTFIDLLNNVRVGYVTESDIALLESRNSNLQVPPDDSIYLFAENSEKDKLNLSKLSLLTTPLVTVRSIDKFPSGICQSRIIQILTYSESRTGGLSGVLNIKTNAHVMLTSNIDINDRSINGQIGTIYSIKYDAQSLVQVIYVNFNDTKAGLMKMRSDPYASQNNVVPIHRIELNIPISLSGSGPSFLRTQFPLMLAWACTVHKVQGLTLSNVVVSFELNRQKRFNYGQIYVVLSRSKALSNLFINGTVKASMMNADADVNEEYARLRTHCRFQCDNAIEEHSSKLSITLLNIRSLQKHSIDLATDTSLKSDVFLLTETQLSGDTFYDNIQQPFNDHQLFLHNNVDKFKSLALLKLFDLDCNIERFDSVLYLEFLISETEIITVLLLYRSNNSHLPSFTEFITYIVETHKPDILLGDFNLNALVNPIPALVSGLTNTGYQLELHEPTHVMGGLIDHVYTSELFRSKYTCSVKVSPVYYSDHDAISLQIC